MRTTPCWSVAWYAHAYVRVRTHTHTHMLHLLSQPLLAEMMAKILKYTPTNLCGQFLADQLLDMPTHTCACTHTHTQCSTSCHNRFWLRWWQKILKYTPTNLCGQLLADQLLVYAHAYVRVRTHTHTHTHMLHLLSQPLLAEMMAKNT